MDAKAYRVQKNDQGVEEIEIETVYLGNEGDLAAAVDARYLSPHV
jgi:hypothetical protein